MTLRVGAMPLEVTPVAVAVTVNVAMRHRFLGQGVPTSTFQAGEPVNANDSQPPDGQSTDPEAAVLTDVIVGCVVADPPVPPAVTPALTPVTVPPEQYTRASRQYGFCTATVVPAAEHPG